MICVKYFGPIQSPVKTFGTLIKLLLSAWKSLVGYTYKALWRLLGHSSNCCCLHESPWQATHTKPLWRLCGHSSNWCCLHESPWLVTHTKPCEDFWDSHQIGAVCMKVPGRLHIQSPVKALGTLIKLVLSAWKCLAGDPYKALWRLLEH